LWSGWPRRALARSAIAARRVAVGLSAAIAATAPPVAPAPAAFALTLLRNGLALRDRRK
jgi:hypothetical protein